MEEGAKRGSADFRLLASDQIQVGIHWESMIKLVVWQGRPHAT